MSDTVFKFGAGKACTSIEVAPFTSICSKPAVPGSEALTLEVPAPVFAPVVPPQECACFAFKDGKANVTVTMEAGHGSGSGTASVGIAATGDCCNGAYEVTPTIDITVPECVTADHVIYSNTTDLGYGGSITCTLGIKDCIPYFEMSSVPVSVTLPNIPNLCLGATTIEVKATYIDANGTEQTATSGSVTVSSSVDDNSCQKYSFGAITLDLTDLPTGGFGNGGSVFKDDGDNNLYMDGGLGDGDTWYGGGIGDRAADNYEEQVFCRGPAMRGYASPAGSGDHPVPYVNNVSGNTSLFKITADGGTRQAVAWCSRGRASDGSDAVGATPSGYVDGNLSMVLPTGFQRHAKGLAINLCDFEWNESGLLSLMHETGMAVLVSPAPMVFSDNAAAYATGAPRAGAAAGGLRIDPDKDTTLKTEPGLYIAAGDGLRVFGLDAKTPSGEGADASGVTAAGRIGQLEVMYGPGFRVRKANSGTTPQYLDAPADAAGALVPNDGRGLRVHGVTKTTTAETDNGQKNKLEVYGHSGDFLFNYDGKMVLNDEYKSSETEGTARPSNFSAFARTTDYTIPTVVASYKNASNAMSAYWSTTSGMYVPATSVNTTDIAAAQNALNDVDDLTWDQTGDVGSIHQGMVAVMGYCLSVLTRFNYFLGTLGIAQAHVSRCGSIMAVDKNETSQSVTRHYAASAS